MHERWRRLLREPMIHFVAAGAVLFAIHAIVAPDVPAAPRIDDGRTIVVSRRFVDELARAEAERTGRAPDAAERAALIDGWLEEELLVREAASLGLGRGDPIVRRRLVQKMEFLLDDATVSREPGDDELTAWLAAHADRYREPRRWTFTHAFFRTEVDASAALASPERAGVAFPLGPRFVHRSRAQIASTFGDDFASSIEAIDTIGVGVWTGPIRSAQGYHLVRIDERIEARTPDVNDVRARLRTDWLADRRANARREALRTLRAQVRVVEEP